MLTIRSQRSDSRYHAASKGDMLSNLNTTTCLKYEWSKRAVRDERHDR